MEIDPQFEFECPKWADFEGGDEILSDACLDTSWFERDHPLHEPKDKIHEPKPLIALDENRKNSSNGSSETENKLPKNTVKRPIDKQRRQGRRLLPDVDKISNKRTEVSKGKKIHSAEFWSDREFTPPSSSPMQSEKDASLLHSPLRGNLYSSPSLNSPKRKLLVRAVSNAASGDENRRKRKLPSIPNDSQVTSHFMPVRANSDTDENQSPRILENTNQFSQHTLPSTTRQEDKSLEEMLKKHNQKVMVSKFKYDNNGRRIKSMNSPSTLIENVCMMNNSAENGVEQSTSKKPAHGFSVQHGKKYSSSGGNDLNSIDEKNPITSVEDLLKSHNKRITASKSKYDSNGRRIQPGNPSFCPAPKKDNDAVTCETLTRAKKQSCVVMGNSEKSSTTKRTKRESRRSCVAAPSTLHANKQKVDTELNLKASKNKRRSCVEMSSTSSLASKPASKSLKQKRRSCFAVPKDINNCKDVDDELKILIDRHNQRLAMHK